MDTNLILSLACAACYGVLFACAILRARSLILPGWMTPPPPVKPAPRLRRVRSLPLDARMTRTLRDMRRYHHEMFDGDTCIDE